MASIDSNGMFQHQQPSGNTNNHSPNNHRHHHHHHHYHDEEAGGGPGSAKFGDYELSSGDPFDIPQTKNASLETLKRWRQAALVLNASRQFRYTLDLKREKEKKQRRRMIRSHAQVIRAAVLFKLAGENQIVIGPSATPSTPTGDYGIGLEQLVSITRDHSISALQKYGGVKGVSQLLKTNLEKGITEDETDLIKWKNSFGSNTYPRKKGQSFLRFLWEAWQDLTLIILIVAAVVSLALGIKTEGVKEGWYDGGSIAFAVFLVIIVTAVSDYRQSLQFQNLNDEKRNIQVELGMNFDLARSESMILQVFPFNSEKKCGGVTVKLVPFGDDDFDLAKRNDTAERLRKHLPPPFAGAGTISKDDVGHEVDNIEANGNLDMGNGDTGDSDDEYYKQVEQRRASRTSAGSSSPEPVDGNHKITYQMENIVSVEGRDGGATPDIDCGFDLTPHIGRTRGTTTVGIAFSQASNSVEGQEASSSGHNGGSGAGSGSDESDQSTGSGGTDTNEGRSRRVGGDEHDEDDRDKGNDEDRRGAGDLESGTRRVGNLSNMKLVAIFIAIIVASSCAIIDLSLVGLPPLARELFTGALVTNLVGFLCLHAALFPNCHISQRATEILVRVGGAAGAFGFLLMLGIRLSLRIIIPACLFVLAVFVLSFRQ